LQSGNAAAVASVLSKVLQKNTSSIVAVGHKGLETGMIVRLIETTNDKPVLDGWSFGMYGGMRQVWDIEKDKISTLGIVVEKSLIKKPLFDIGAGVLVTAPVRDFLKKSQINVAAGFSVSF
jgi:hypothetical protein